MPDKNFSRPTETGRQKIQSGGSDCFRVRSDRPDRIPKRAHFIIQTQRIETCSQKKIKENLPIEFNSLTVRSVDTPRSVKSRDFPLTGLEAIADLKLGVGKGSCPVRNQTLSSGLIF